MPRSPPAASSTTAAQTAHSPGTRFATRRRATLTDTASGSPLVQSLSSAANALEVSSTLSSSPSRFGSFHYGSPRGLDDTAILSSPASVYSSPNMTRSMSAHSVFATSPRRRTQPGLHESSPLGRIDSSPVAPRPVRESVKRKRVAADRAAATASLYGSPSMSPSAVSDRDEPDSDHVWPRDVDEAFFRALHLLPRLGRRKLLIDNKPCGRNELIADYIHRTTGKVRTRKQVSSHVQVLKNMYREDPEFLELVNEPEIESDQFVGDNARLFFGDDSPYAVPGANLQPPRAGPAKIDVKAARSLSTAMSRSDSAPALHSPFILHPSHLLGAASPTAELSNAFQVMSVLADSPASLACDFSLAHIEFATCWEASPIRRLLCRGGNNSPPDRRISLSDVPESDVRYASLYGPTRPSCQYLYAKLHLAVPDQSFGHATLDARVALQATQALSLTVSTKIYCHGEVIIQFSGALATPNRTDEYPDASTGRDPTAPRPVYVYDVPFAATFWSHLLATGPDQTFGCAGRERDDLAQNLRAFSVVQEFAFTPNAGSSFASGDNAGDEDMTLDLGDLVLVAAYDLQLCGVHDACAGSVELARLDLAAPAPLSDLPDLPFLPVSPSATSMARSATLPSLSNPRQNLRPPRDMASPLSRSTNSTRGYAPYHKPNLSLHIPPPSRFLRPSIHLSPAIPPASKPTRKSSTPSTPWEQVVHTPHAPPPVLHDPFADAQQHRLENIWLQNATNDWELHSPALLGMSQPAEGDSSLPSYARYSAAPGAKPYESVPMQPSASLPVYLTAHDPTLPPASETFRAFTSGATFDDLHANIFLRTPSPVSATTSVPHQPVQDDIFLPRSPNLVDGIATMSTTSSSTGSTTSTTVTKASPPLVAAAVDTATYASPPQVRPADDTPEKAKARHEQDFFSQLFGSKTKYTGIY